jgi:cephalosporin hydroxylase
MTIDEKFTELCNTPSDINELLPIIASYASECSHLTEFGVRIPTSTYALLVDNPKKVISYDIGRYPQVDEVEELCKAEGIDFQFILANVLEIDIEPTEMLFSDTYHSYNQLKAELDRHADKVTKYIGVHDWGTYKMHSEDWYPGVADFMNGPDGLKRAVDEFLDQHPEWLVDFETDDNNGLLILKRHES